MANTLASQVMAGTFDAKKTSGDCVKKLSEGRTDEEYTIKGIETDDDELKSFLFSLGCYEGEKVTVISVLGENYVISVKDARYSINLELAKVISI